MIIKYVYNKKGQTKTILHPGLQPCCNGFSHCCSLLVVASADSKQLIFSPMGQPHVVDPFFVSGLMDSRMLHTTSFVLLVKDLGLFFGLV